MINLKQTEQEVHNWSLINFGYQPASNPLLGIAEEFGELIEAIMRGKGTTFEIDAIGDCQVYTLDFCGNMFIEYEDAIHPYIIGRVLSNTRSPEPIYDGIIWLGKLNHAFLKHEQNIRTGENHREAIKEALGNLFLCLVDIANMRKISNPLDCLELTWAKVKQRNWKENPETGGDAVMDTAPAEIKEVA